MRSRPYRVVFVGPPDPRLDRLLTGLSPTIHPIPSVGWEAVNFTDERMIPELVAVLPGEAAIPGLSWESPVWFVAEADLQLPLAQFEARLLEELALPPRAKSKILGTAPVMARFRGTLATMAKTTLPLLLSGENGTGKDLAATEAHGLSTRVAQPFVAVNCGAIPPGLAETEFFGCVRGAFTGAENRSGFCQQAMGGTLFLDEIGELVPELQSKLLRALENQEIRRVGSTRIETVDFRLICATNRDLATEVKAGRFREDLYYRINVLPLRMPALRERKEDLPLLTEHFLKDDALGPATPRRATPKALAKMADYHWPGNLRQLRNVLLRAAVLHPGWELGPDHILWDV